MRNAQNGVADHIPVVRSLRQAGLRACENMVGRLPGQFAQWRSGPTHTRLPLRGQHRHRTCFPVSPAIIRLQAPEAGEIVTEQPGKEKPNGTGLDLDQGGGQCTQAGLATLIAAAVKTANDCLKRGQTLAAGTEVGIEQLAVIAGL